MTNQSGKNQKKIQQQNGKASKIIKKRKLSKKTLVIFKVISYISFLVLVFFTYCLIHLDVLPFKYLLPILGVIFLFDIFSIFAIHRLKKGFKIVGLILSIFLILFGSVGSYYTYNTDAFLNRSFRSGKMLFSANYYIVVPSSSAANTLNEVEGSMSYLSGANLIDEAINELKNQKTFEMKPYDDVTSMFTDLKNSAISSILVEQTSYDLVMSLNQGFTKDDFKVVHSFEVSIEVDSSANANEDGKFHIYIGGNDFTNRLIDFNMIVTINRKSHKILMTSIPRDYYIPVAGDGRRDTLSFMGSRGINTNRTSLAELFEINLDYFIKINTKSLVGIVDQVDGIDYCSDYAYYTTHATILDTYDDSKGKKLYVQKGCQHLNGIQALTVARERLAFPGGDRQRQKNCQQIIKAIFKQLVSTNTITNYNNILNALGDLYETNIPREMITDLVKETINGANWEITEQSVDGKDGYDNVYLSGLKSFVLNPNMDTVHAAKDKMVEILR